MKELLNYIRADLGRIAPPSLVNFFRVYFNPHMACFRYVVNLRIVHFSKKNIISKVFIAVPAYVILMLRERNLGIHCNSNIDIGKGLHIVYGGGIFLNVSSIGENFTIFQNVTFGKRHKNDGVPIVGNGVTCYTGSVICGPVKIGDNSTIGANSYVNKDVPENVIVAGLPARVIKQK